jgi:hypothetical protein
MTCGLSGARPTRCCARSSTSSASTRRSATTPSTGARSCSAPRARLSRTASRAGSSRTRRHLRQPQHPLQRGRRRLPGTLRARPQRESGRDRKDDLADDPRRAARRLRRRVLGGRARQQAITPWRPQGTAPHDDLRGDPRGRALDARDLPDLTIDDPTAVALLTLRIDNEQSPLLDGLRSSSRRSSRPGAAALVEGRVAMRNGPAHCPAQSSGGGDGIRRCAGCRGS